jgi:ppGpp synthetase/RelA/SpoT-type nucleotidyltranferase
MTPAQYEAFTRPHRRLLRQLEPELRFYFEDVGPLSLFAIETRVKSYESATKKFQAQKLVIEQLYDLAGIRIVVGTRHDVTVAKRFFEMKQFVKDASILKEWAPSNRQGYRSTHMVLAWPPHYTRGRGLQLEVQLPTILEHSYNFLSHAWAYKSEVPVDGAWRARFERVAHKLKKLDEELGELASTHAEVSASCDDAPLTPFSYRHVVKTIFDEEVELADAADTVRRLRDFNIQTNGALAAFFRNEAVQQGWAWMRQEAAAGNSFAASMTYSATVFWLLFGVSQSSLDGILETTAKHRDKKEQESG